MIYSIIIKEQAEKDLLRIKLYISYELKMLESVATKGPKWKFEPQSYKI